MQSVSEIASVSEFLSMQIKNEEKTETVDSFQWEKTLAALLYNDAEQNKPVDSKPKLEQSSISEEIKSKVALSNEKTTNDIDKTSKNANLVLSDKTKPAFDRKSFKDLKSNINKKENDSTLIDDKKSLGKEPIKNLSKSDKASSKEKLIDKEPNTQKEVKENKVESKKTEAKREDSTLTDSVLAFLNKASNETQKTNDSQKPNEKKESKDSTLEIIGTSSSEDKKGTKINVVDLRMQKSKDTDKKSLKEDSKEKNDNVKFELKADTKNISTENFNDSVQNEISTFNDSGLKTETFLDTGVEKNVLNQSSMSEKLASQLQDGANDLVKAANIVLKDGDNGIIRLRLNPESLGGVKIELKMAEKQLSGRIIVESDIAGEAFKSTINSLKDAFAESGFDVRSLSVEVRNNSEGNNGQAQNQQNAETNEMYFSKSLRELENAVPSVDTRMFSSSVNVLV